MTIFYSAATNGFYPDSLKDSYEQAGCWPADGVEVSEHWHNYLISNQGSGKEILPDAQGLPVLRNKPEPTLDELIIQAEATRSMLMTKANESILPLQDAVDLGMASDQETARLKKWKTYRVLLSRVDSANPEWPEVPQ